VNNSEQFVADPVDGIAERLPLKTSVLELMGSKCPNVILIMTDGTRSM
jgi:hypothetical protein